VVSREGKRDPVLAANAPAVPAAASTSTATSSPAAVREVPYVRLFRLRLHHSQRSLLRTIAAFREYRPGEEGERRAAIERVDSKDWRGVRVFRVHCDGDFGRGPHEHWVPEYILWSLIDVTRYRCPYHR
jgi:hypothetical protein